MHIIVLWKVVHFLVVPIEIILSSTEIQLITMEDLF